MAQANIVYILNGSNLNLLGEREPHIYGAETLLDLETRCAERASELGLEIVFRQTNFEGEIVESVHEARNKAAAIIINPAGFTFYSVALMDALLTFAGVKIEVHLTSRHKRDAVYHNSLVSKVADGLIEGLKGDGYLLALEAVAMKLARQKA